MSRYNNNITGETIINNVYNMYYEIPLFLDGHSLIINKEDHQEDQDQYIMQVAMCSNGEKNKKRKNQRKRKRTNQKKRRKAKAKAKRKANAKKRRKAKQNKKIQIQIQIQIQICSYCSKDITTGDQHCYKKYRL